MSYFLLRMSETYHGSMSRADDPRGRLLDAALAVIGSEGMRGLTHRRLEDEAGLARGSARYHLGTNDQIIAATLEHAAQRELQLIEGTLVKLGLDALAGSTASIPKMCAAMISGLLENPGAIRARYELLLAATRKPSLKAEAQRWRAHFVGNTEVGLTAAGVDDPHGAAVLLVAILDGLTLDAIIADRTSAPELAERAAAAILRASAATS
jgi:TetR/AcrR family transcriptional regulator, regulator of biofilm formation and stress response